MAELPSFEEFRARREDQPARPLRRVRVRKVLTPGQRAEFNDRIAAMEKRLAELEEQHAERQAKRAAELAAESPRRRMLRNWLEGNRPMIAAALRERAEVRRRREACSAEKPRTVAPSFSVASMVSVSSAVQQRGRSRLSAQCVRKKSSQPKAEPEPPGEGGEGVAPRLVKRRTGEWCARGSRGTVDVGSLGRGLVRGGGNCVAAGGWSL